ncbi:uncharacterized protein LOC114758025 isoform X2 [Neltuma alba]|uniref:uncharacterized protein LOC114758025 isoform X2 n=1 Tax=Neltuma alba TaxID=207710 RepID=UPI0010A3B7E9|nr:uncharacterized protein LOC114758025 isoform X2 [Prosopis alba]
MENSTYKQERPPSKPTKYIEEEEEGTWRFSLRALREVTPEGNSVDLCCKTGEGWTCVVTKTSGPDAGKSIKCDENCSLTIEGDKVCKEESKEVGDTACCKCGEGWSCVISKA